jgi:hypothetical protein
MKTKKLESADNAEDGLLRDARVYLSGPMDFVASRATEKATGWRTRIGQFLRRLGVIVFDPWEKPEVRSMHDYGREGEGTTDARAAWTYKTGEEGAAARAQVAESFWGALHIDLRMVDTSDFVICYCPTNVYSVGTPHEIILARDQRKPVLFVSPYVSFPALSRLREHLAKNAAGTALLEDLVAQVPIKENKNASPSLWYMPLVGGEHFFDGFGFSLYRERFGWTEISLDKNEEDYPPQKPLLPFLEKLNRELPLKWDRTAKKFARNDDWLLWDLHKHKSGASVADAKQAKSPQRAPRSSTAPTEKR